MNQPFQFTIQQLLVVTALVAVTMWLVTTCRAGEPTEAKRLAILIGIPSLVSGMTGALVGKPLRWAMLFGLLLGCLIVLAWSLASGVSVIR